MESAARLPSGGGWMVAAAVVTAAVAAALAWIVSEKMSRGRGKLPPGPLALPVLGNLLELVIGEHLLHRAMAKLSKTYGPIVFLKVGIMPTVVISSCALARACLTGNNDKIFAGRPPMEAARRLVFGERPGIALTSYGDAWRQMRRLCSLQLFTAKRVSEFEPMRRSQIMALVRRIKQNGGEPVNLTQAIGSLTEGLTSAMLLGKPLAEIWGDGEGINMQTLIQRMTEVVQVPIIGDFIPALGFLDRSTKSKLDEVHAGFETLFSKLILERKRPSPDSPQVILDVLLDNLDADWAKSVMLELIAAGIDTSATTLDWVMGELVENPQVMKRLQQELDKVAGGDDRFIEEAELGELAYMKAVLKETMRLHPAAPMLMPHMSMEACYVNGYRIPKGSQLLVNAWAIGRDPSSWPDQPERFMPERFLTDEGALIDFHGQHFELLPFGGGRRSCPGLPLALPLLESALTNLVHTFDWSLPPGQYSVDMSERFSTVVSRATPLFAIPRLRLSDHADQNLGSKC